MVDNDVLVAQRLLTEAWGAPVSLAHLGDLGGSDRSKVGRYEVRPKSSAYPDSVVIKRATPQQSEAYDQAAAEGPAPRLFNEWAGLQFLGELEPGYGLAPKLYAGDQAAGLIIIEDLGDGVQLDHLLLGKDAQAAEAGLLALMQSLGQLHAQTAGRAERYNKLRDALGPRTAPRTMPVDNVMQLQDRVSTFATAVLGDDWRVNSAEFTQLHTFLQPDNPFYTYSHEDPCPDNCLFIDGKIKLLDFEFGAFRHALLDCVYAHIHFPTCWCVNRIPATIVDQMEQVYRQELAKGCAAAADDTLFQQAIAEACAWQQLSRLPVSLLDNDLNWGISTVRQRTLTRLALFADAADKANHLSSLGELAYRLQKRLRELWGDELAPMPFYPAFR